MCIPIGVRCVGFLSIILFTSRVIREHSLNFANNLMLPTLTFCESRGVCHLTGTFPLREVDILSMDTFRPLSRHSYPTVQGDYTCFSICVHKGTLTDLEVIRVTLLKTMRFAVFLDLPPLNWIQLIGYPVLLMVVLVFIGFPLYCLSRKGHSYHRSDDFSLHGFLGGCNIFFVGKKKNYYSTHINI